MRHLPLRRLSVAGLAALALVVAGCSSKATQTSEGTDGSGVKTGPGVTADTITLGALTDLSGVFGAQGKIIVQGNQLYLDKINAAGGVCGRKLDLVVKDHGTDVQKAVSLYAELEPQVLGFVQMLGSPITTALNEDITADQALTVATGWSSTLLKNPNMIVLGNTYDVETVNGIDYLTKQKGLKAADVIGHIYFEGDYGNNAFLGSKAAAAKLGLTVEAIQIKASEADMTAQVTTLKARGAKAIILSTGPRQTASVAGVAASLGYDVPLIGNFPAFDPSLLATPAKAALEKNLYVMSSIAPFAAAAAGPQEVAEALPKKFPDTTPNNNVDVGYVSVLIYAKVLEKACANGDLTRAGVTAAFRQLTSVDTAGVTPVLDFSTSGAHPSRLSYILKVDSSVAGGLAVALDATESETAKAYTPAA